MLRLENVKNKRQALYDFFVWLFDDNRIIDKSITLYDEVDLSLCSSYSDPNIYYPSQIKKFFDTKAMHRLGRISQLGSLAINIHPNLYHTRLEHSKGVYNKKVEEFFYNFQNPDWRKYIEDNNLKLYLIAELIKMAGHDIGHLPLSHAFEEQIIGKRGVHEEIGKRIMLENSEIQEILSSISPCLNSILAELYNNNMFNFSQHDESNYDIDRLDYLSRDALYQGFNVNFPMQIYKTVCVEGNENNEPILKDDNSISESFSGNCFIDVYDYSSLPEILKVLKERESQYIKLYVSPKLQVFEASIKNFFKAFLTSDCTTGNDLKLFLSNLRDSKVEDLDLDEFISWDELSFYSSLLDIAENSEDSNLRDLATLIIPSMSGFLTIIYSFLNMHNKSQSYSDDDKKFLQRIKELIKSNSILATNLKDTNFAANNIIYVPKDVPLADSNIKNLMSHFSYNLRTYKPSEPIYVRDKYGKIYELSSHPEVQDKISTDSRLLQTDFVSIPYLRFNGINNDTIDSLKSLYPFGVNLHTDSKSSKVNLQPLQVGHNIADEFLEL